MNIVLEKIHLRLTLLCKKYHLDFDIEKTKEEIKYLLSDDRLGFSEVKVVLVNDNTSLKLVIGGTNDGILKISDEINKNETVLGIPIENYSIFRQNFQNSFLTISFNEAELDQIEQSELKPKDTDSKRKIFPRKAYSKICTNSDAVILEAVK